MEKCLVATTPSILTYKQTQQTDTGMLVLLTNKTQLSWYYLSTPT